MNRETIYDAEKRVTQCMMTLKGTEVKERFPVSLIDVNCWEWPQGIGLFGLYRSYVRNRSEDVLAFLLNGTTIGCGKESQRKT